MDGAFDPKEFIKSAPNQSQDSGESPNTNLGAFDPKRFIKDNSKSDEKIEFEHAAPSVIGTVKSLGTGAVKGAASAFGTLGDVRDLVKSGAKYFGASDEDLNTAYNAATNVPYLGLIVRGAQHAPTSGDINQKVQQTFGQYHKPQNKLEEYAESIGEAGVGSGIGPGGFARKVGMGVLGGIGAQSVGDVAKSLDPSLEGAGRIIGGALLPYAGERKFINQRNVPSMERYQEVVDNGYNFLKQNNVHIPPTSFYTTANNMENSLIREGYRRTNREHRPIFNAIDELRNIPSGVQQPDFHDLESIRKVLNRVGADPRLRDGVRLAINELDQTAMAHMPIASAIRSNFAAMKRSEAVETALEKAANRTITTGNKTNIENPIKQELRKLYENPRMMRGWTPEEKRQLKDAFTGSKTEQLISYIGSYAPTGPIKAAVFKMLGEGFGGPMHAILGTAAYGAKKLSEGITARKAEDVATNLRARSAEARRAGAQSYGQYRDEVNRARLAALVRAKTTQSYPEQPSGYPYIYGGQ